MNVPPKPERTGRAELEVDDEVRAAAARCLHCGTPLCRLEGCVLGNRIPEIHELVARGRWEAASRTLHATDNFPELTGRLCGRSCQMVCVQGHTDRAAPIRAIECHVAERAFAEGWIEPQPAARSTGRKAAVAGSGPAALAMAQELARAGHEVAIYDHSPWPGGALRQGAVDGELDSYLLDRRLRQLAAEGVKFFAGLVPGRDILAGYLLRQYDVLCIAQSTLGQAAPHGLPLGVPVPAGGRGAQEWAELIAQLPLALEDSGRLAASDCRTCDDRVFVVVDLGADLSLIAAAIHNGREAAIAVDRRLQN